jgi:hypothetical protein
MVTHTKRKIHFSFLFFFLISFTSLNIYGQEVIIKVIKPLTPFKGRFEFEVVNNSDTTLRYFVSLERFINDSSWREIRSDLFNIRHTKKARVLSIEKGKTNEQYFNLNKPSHDVDNDKYRLKLEYFKSFIEGRKIAYSQSFIIPS